MEAYQGYVTEESDTTREKEFTKSYYYYTNTQNVLYKLEIELSVFMQPKQIK